MNEIVRAGGQFAKGHSGNPSGRPKRVLIDYQHSLEQIVREHITADKVKRILNKLVEQAENGDVKAAKLIIDKLIPNAVPDTGDTDTGRVVTFHIVNATFAATHSSAARIDTAIDAEVVQTNPQLDVTPSVQESNE